MKIGLLADIHSNYDALSAVLNEAERLDLKHLLIAGDFVGYYFKPSAVLKLLSSWSFDAIRGNHEEMLEKSLGDRVYLESIEQKYGSGIREAINQLSEEELNYLCSLPHPLEIALGDRKILLCHGAPDDLNHYVYPDTNLDGLTIPCESHYDLIVTGHTHYPMKRLVGSSTWLVNPGSVGQTRNRKPGAYWALYDTDTDEIRMMRQDYDYIPLQREARRRHPELPYLAEVLSRR